MPFENESVFNNLGMDEHIKVIDSLKKSKEEDVLNNVEFMEQARVNSEKVMKQLLTSADATRDYDVIFK